METEIPRRALADGVDIIFRWMNLWDSPPPRESRGDCFRVGRSETRGVDEGEMEGAEDEVFFAGFCGIVGDTLLVYRVCEWSMG